MSFEIHIGPNVRQSAYYQATVAEGVRSFSVYNHMYLPGHFGDPEAEYARLLEDVVMWDVAAQRQVELRGPDAGALVSYLTPRNVARATVGQGLYVPICDHDGWLINDPVLLKLDSQRFWLSLADSDLALWAMAIARERRLAVEVFEPDVSPMAIQGPRSIDVVAALFGAWVRDLKRFQFRKTQLDDIPLVLARSGWSKQGGFELYLQDHRRGNVLWQRVKDAGKPFGIGPGAPNDIERLESGLISYGADCRRQSYPSNPFEMGFGPMVQFDAGEFVGRDALLQANEQGIRRRRVGVFIDGPRVSGNAHPVALYRGDAAVGHVSELAYSPRLARNIGVGLVGNDIEDDERGLQIEQPDGRWDVAITQLPFL